MSLRMQIIVSILFVVALTGTWSWWPIGGDGAKSRERASQKATETLVLVEPARATEKEIQVRTIGTGESRRSATIHAAVSGEVVNINFEAGQRVKKGRVLLRLDDKHQRLAVRLADVAVKEAARQMKRMEKLAPTGAASIARLETTETTLESAKVRLDQAKADLRDRTVHAPFDGVIGLTSVDIGDRITVDTPIATLDDRSYIKVAFNVPEDYTAGVRIGTLVTVHPRTMPGKRFKGVVSAMGSRIDPLTRSLKVEAELINKDDTLRPGSSFEVRLSFVGATYPSVREVAVLWSRDGAYLWRVMDGRVEKVFVKIAQRDSGRILVDGPLKIGDLIVVEGVQGLRAGQQVKTRALGADKIGTQTPASPKRSS